MSFKDLVGIFLNYVNTIVSVLIGVLVLFFIINVVKGMSKTDSPEGREEFKRSIAVGLLGIFMAISFFAIAKLVAVNLGL